jgi:hypothetical protein
MPMTDMEVGSITITQLLTPDGEQGVRIETDPGDMGEINAAGLLTFALSRMLGNFDPEEDL